MVVQITETPSSVICMEQTIACQDQHVKYTAAQSNYKHQEKT